MKKVLTVLLFFFLAACDQAPTSVENSDIILITNVTVVPMNQEGVLENRSVLVEDGIIAGIFEADQTAATAGVTVIDGTGKFLAPGLIDAHAHVSLRSNFERYLVHGVTSIREMWGLPRRLRWRDAIRNGDLTGPNFVVASTFFWLGGPETVLHLEPTDPETARELVRQVKTDGYDLIKVVDLEDMNILNALIDEAEKQGLSVSGHYPDKSVPLEEMLQVGMASFEHIDEFTSIAFKEDSSDEYIRKIAKELNQRGIGLTTILTRALTYLEIESRGQDFYTAEAKLGILKNLGAFYFQSATRTIDNVIASNGEYTEQWTEGVDLAQRAVVIFLEENVNLAIGTEGIGAFYGASGVGVHYEIAFLKDAGLSNYQVMKVATVNGANVIGFEGHKGLIVEGYDADLILLDANPLIDLETLKNPIGVLVMGHYYSQEDLADLKDIY